MLNNSLIPVHGARRGIVIALSVAAAVAAGIGVAVPRSDASQEAQISGSYKWPVKPFDRQHPVRGILGDPRTIFRAPPTLRGVMTGDGDFSLHRGIDISAPNGASVFPVMSGVVSYADDEYVRVDSGGDRAFEYWHIHALVSPGDRVEAYETVLGHVMRPAAHVHLTELQNGRFVNPLAPGHLAPYRDDTTPRVTSIAFRRTGASGNLLPNLVSGRVMLLAGAEDDPTIDAPAAWRGLPTTPALLTWEIRTWTGKVAVRRQIAADFRVRLPSGNQFWRVYARGTYQNMAVFGRHYSYGQRGSYLFKLSAAPLNTRSLRNGAYDLVVTATDIRGNQSSEKQRFAIVN
jgi:hypothetical protein